MTGLEWLLPGLPAALVVYLLAGGVYLRYVGAQVLKVGPVAAMLEARGRPAAPLAMGYRGDPGRGLGLAFQTVEVAGELGPMPAWLLFDGPQSRLAALYLHGLAGARENGYRYLAGLRAAGIPTLMLAYRNDPGAPAAAEGVYAFGLTEWRDAEAAVGWLRERGHDRLLLIGDSMGAAIIGQLLQRSAHAAAVVAMATDSPALDFTAVLARLGRTMHLPLAGWLARIARLLLDATKPFAMRRAVVTEALRDFAGPLFVAHGTGDRLVPATGSDALLATRRGITVSFRTTADHLLSYTVEPEGFKTAFAAFLTMLPSDRG